GQIEVPAGRFGGAARIDRTWGLDFEGGGNWSQTWVAPDVGMAHQRRRSQFSTGGGPITVTTNEVWELIEWDLMTFGLDQFPNQVGAEWVYEQIDSTPVGIGPVMVVIDTVAVTIVGSGRLESGDSYTMWNYVTANGTDTQYVVTGEERLSFQSDKTFNSLWDIYYYFPLAVGRTWGLEVITPFPDALDKEPVLTPVQRFASSFHVRMSGGGFESSWTQDDWLAPGVGIIKSRRWQFSIGPWMRMNRTRTLISYRPAN
ncbi:MAG: hypothetical protein ACE5GA_09785, partial [Candidatus Zixiibacteriota bacterium]